MHNSYTGQSPQADAYATVTVPRTCWEEVAATAYRRSPFISSAVNLFFENKYPERFVQSANTFRMRSQVKKQIESLKD
ncbi:MAG: hypothetical protein ACI85O_002636 [Saprospiraceae bacterium]|jgi:hypothetical protein